MVEEQREEQEKSGLVLFAEQELARIGQDDEGMQAAMNKHLLDMVKVFSDEDHSGFSAGYAINILERLLRYLPLTPIEDTPEDWNETRPGCYQHRRCSAVFKDKNQFGGKAYFLDAKVFSDDGGESWFTYSDSREVIEFPFAVPNSPKRYLVDEECNILSEYNGKAQKN
jgi:hypothetical protein